jgi:hypothetical protein
LTWEPARRCSKWGWGHAKSAGWTAGKRSRTRREATLRTETVLIWTPGATRATKRRIGTWWKLTMWREVWRWLVLSRL